MRLTDRYRFWPLAWGSALTLWAGLGALSACGEMARPEGDICRMGPAVAHMAAHAAAADANMREALGPALSGIIADGTLRGRGLWQRGEVRRKAPAEAVALPDEADQGIVDGYQYQAYLTPPPPRIARADAHCDEAEDGPGCDDIDAHAHVAIERVGGIAGLTWRSDTLIAYRQLDHITLCACPPSALTERLPLCCSSLCCH